MLLSLLIYITVIDRYKLRYSNSNYDFLGYQTYCIFINIVENFSEKGLKKRVNRKKLLLKVLLTFKYI